MDNVFENFQLDLDFKTNATIYEYQTVDEAETMTLANLVKGVHQNFEVLLFTLEGKLIPKEYIENYKKIIQEYPVYRTVYSLANSFGKKKLNTSEASIPFYDLRKLGFEEKINLLENVYAAECRRIYNPEKDMPLKITGYITENNQLTVVMSVYPYFTYPFNKNILKNKIFKGLINSNYGMSDVQKKTIEINKQIENRCSEYWSLTIGDAGSPVWFPDSDEYALPAMEKNTRSFSLGISESDGIRRFAEKKKISVNSFILANWADIILKGSQRTEAVVAMRFRGELTNLLPLKVSYNMDKIGYEAIEKQVNEFAKYSSVSFDNICQYIGVDKTKQFKILFSLKENAKSGISTVNRNIDWAVPVEIELDTESVEYALKFIYDPQVITETQIETYYEVFLGLIKNECGSENTFKWKTYITQARDEIEKRKAILEVCIAKAMDKAGLIVKGSSEDALKLIQASQIRTYAEEDAVYDPASEAKGIGILFDGTLEERCTDSSGIVKSISIYKPGHMMILGSKNGDKLCDTMYVAYENNTKVIWLEYNNFWLYISSHHEIFLGLIARMSLEIRRLKKLVSIQ